MKAGQCRKSDRRGFTLMEVLVVAAIIAVLVAIAIPTVTRSLEKSRRAADLADARSGRRQGDSGGAQHRLPR